MDSNFRVDSVNIHDTKKCSQATLSYIKNKFKNCQCIADISACSSYIQNNFKCAGIFDNIKTVLDYRDGKYGIDLYAKETGSLKAEGKTSVAQSGASTASVILGYSNLFGNGESISIKMEKSTDKSMGSSLFYTIPMNFEANKRISMHATNQKNHYHDKIIEKVKRFGISFQNTFVRCLHSSTLDTIIREYEKETDTKHNCKILLKNDTIFNIILNNESFGNTFSLRWNNELSRSLFTNHYEFKIDGGFQFLRNIGKYLNVETYGGTGLLFTRNFDLTDVYFADKFNFNNPLVVRGLNPLLYTGNFYYNLNTHVYSKIPFLSRYMSSITDKLRLQMFVNLGDVMDIKNDQPNCKVSYGAGLLVKFSPTIRVELNYIIPKKGSSTSIKRGVQFSIGCIY
ncbi:Sorting and assembly machinery component 50 [Intoshia linei]|uniref:Sorting and assembly machinery component 50 n=1 Tax=Intoshia linei TaxID=1819745 RepID=A0A177BAA3_9BILA|nr:Sorting and assembly machinery component 50 [Intoshia linei]